VEGGSLDLDRGHRNCSRLLRRMERADDAGRPAAEEIASAVGQPSRRRPNDFVGVGCSPCRCPMPSYVVLVNWTAEGIKAVKKSPERAESFRKAVGEAGGKVLSFLHTMGAYDLVVAMELPSDEVANQLALRTGMQGFVRTTTLKGWSSAEFADLVRKL